MKQQKYQIAKLTSVVFCSILHLGCVSNGPHNPDSVEIKENSWNRQELLSGVWAINVLGESSLASVAFIDLRQPTITTKEFTEINSIWQEAIASTCPKGIKQVIQKTSYLERIQAPSISYYQAEIPGGIIARPWINSAVQCIGSTATASEIQNEFFKDQVNTDKSMNELMNKISITLPTATNN